MAVSLVPAAASPTIDMLGIARLLGIHQRADAWRVRYIAQLIAEAHFPPPFPYQRAGRLRRDISSTYSRWHRGAVMAWIDGQLPPDLVRAIDDEAAHAAAARMDARAAGLAA